MENNKWNKVIIMFLIAAMLVLILAVLNITAIVTNALYTKTEYCQVVENDGGIIVLESADGNLWEYETDDHYWIGEVVKVRFDTKSTSSIYDDEIIAIGR